MKGSITLTREASFIKPDQYYSSRKYLAATLSILFLALVHAVIVFAVVESNNLNADKFKIEKILNTAYLMYSITLVGILLLYTVSVMVLIRPKRLVSYLIRGYRWHLLSTEKLLFSYPVLAIISSNLSIYTFFKNNIPNLNPFWLDGTLHKLDKVLFLGNDPWRVLQLIIGDPTITRAIDFLYHPLWAYLLLFFFLYHALGPHSLETRLRFFLSYIIVWTVLGNALATLLSSAGPCYFTQVTGQPSPYAELMGYLRSITEHGSALNAVRMQELLWNIRVNTDLEFGSGISAMPSIHIATATLFALSMRKTYPIAEKLLYCYTFIIWAGSVHLGWHYATDGPVSVLCVIAIWHYTGKLTTKILPEKKVQQAKSLKSRNHDSTHALA